MSDDVTPIVSDESRRGRRRIIMLIALAAVVVVSYTLWGLMGLLYLSNTEEGLVGIMYRYVGLPAWLIILPVGTVKIVRWMRSPRAERQRPLGVVIIVLMVAAALMFVAKPLLDVPYLFNPAVVELHDVEAVESTGNDRTYYSLRGTDETGKPWTFRINHDTYRAWDEDRTTATITGLPRTQVTLSID